MSKQIKTTKMIYLYSTEKYYDVNYKNIEYNILTLLIGEVVDQVTVFRQGDVITESEEAKKVLEYFYNNLETE